MTRTGSDLQFVELTKKFGNVLAVDNLSLSIESGEFVSLLGPSGCGKSTMLRMIAGFESPTTGDIFIRGQRITGIPPHKRNIGLVFQNYALFPHMRVDANVEFGVKAKKFPRSERAVRVRNALSTVRLSEFADRYPNQLSGGQQQRVALARALAIEPDVMLLDEPLAALDKKLREEMQLELRDLHQRFNMTTIFVTHDQEEALTLSDRVAVMRDGVIEQIGTPTEVYEHPKTQFVATFLGANNILDGEVVSRSGSEMRVEFAVGATKIVAGPLNVGDKIVATLRPERIKIVSDDSDDGVVGEITSVVYVGYNAQVRVRCRDHAITALVQNDRANATALHPGQTVKLAWDANDLSILEHPA